MKLSSRFYTKRKNLTEKSVAPLCEARY